jgi:hypothetical protein
MIKLRSGRAPALPRGRWCAPDRRLSSGRHPPLYHGQSLRPRWNIPPAGVTLTRRQRRFTHSPITPDDWLPSADREPQNRFPPIFSSPAVPGWNKDHFGFDLGLRTPQLPATHAEAETGHRALARVLHPQHHHQSSLQRCLPLALMHPHIARSPKWLPSRLGSRPAGATGPPFPVGSASSSVATSCSRWPAAWTSGTRTQQTNSALPMSSAAIRSTTSLAPSPMPSRDRCRVRRPWSGSREP